MGMFDLTPEMVPYQQQQQDTQAGLAAGALGPVGNIISAANVGGNMIGRGIGGALGYQNPMMQQAQRLQMAMRDTDGSGIDYGKDPVSYMNLAAKNLFKYGLYDQGMSVTDKVKELAQSQQAMATTAATNLSTSQKASAVQRINEINQAFSMGPNGYNQKGAIAAMMRDPNPEVQARGINLAKEQQSLDIGKLVPRQPGTDLVDSETRQVVGGDTGEYKAVSWPGEQESETERRWLTDLSQIARQRQLTQRESIIARQAFSDYGKMNAGMQGIVDRNIDPSLNPNNWGQQNSASQNGPQPAPPNAAPVGPGAGRTSPSSVTLPSGIKQEAPGKYQGAAGQTLLDNDVRTFSEHIRQANIPQTDIAMREVTGILDKYKDNPDALPGVGYVKNLPDGTVLGTAARFFMTEEGKDVKSKIQNAIAQVMRSDIGATQTVQEASRELTRFLYSTSSNARDFFNGWRNFTESYNGGKGNIISGTAPEVLQRYEQQSKNTKARGYGSSAMDLSPIPVVKIKPVQDLTNQPIVKPYNPNGGGSSLDFQDQSNTWEDGDYLYRKLPDGTIQRKKK